MRRESTGFIFNRIWAAIKGEALDVVAAGVSTPDDVDEMWKLTFGTEIGPFRAMNRVGFDVVYDIEEHYAAENPHLPPGPRELLRHYLAAGKLGVKTGEGCYADYPKMQTAGLTGPLNLRRQDVQHVLREFRLCDRPAGGRGRAARARCAARLRN